MPRAVRQRLLVHRLQQTLTRGRQQARHWMQESRGQGGVEARPALAHAAEVRIAVYGEWAPPWMLTLGPASALWGALSGVSEVRHFLGPATELTRYAASDGPPVIVIPMLEPHALWVPDGLRFGVAPRAAIRLLGDKAAFAGFAAERFPNCVPAVWADPDAVCYPCMVKPAQSLGSEGIMVATGRDELFNALEQKWLAGERVLMQAQVAGTRERTLHAMCAAGQILWFQTFDKPNCLTPQLLTEADQEDIHLCSPDPGALDVLRRVVAELRYAGPLCMDYRMDGDALRIFEINPRFGGTLMKPRFEAQIRAALSALLALRHECHPSIADAPLTSTARAA